MEVQTMIAMKEFLSSNDDFPMAVRRRREMRMLLPALDRAG
jgi:hypothetical protein